MFNNNWGKTVGLLTQRRFMDPVREDMQRTAVAEEDAGDRVRLRHRGPCSDPYMSSQKKKKRGQY